MHNQQPPGVVQNWSTLQCSKQNTEQCGYAHAPVTRGRMRAQFPLPHGPMHKKRISCIVIYQKVFHNLLTVDYEKFVNAGTSG